jgi:hypothetical protein
MAIGTVFTITGREATKASLFNAIANARSRSSICTKIWETIEKSPVKVDFIVFRGGGNAEMLVDEEVAVVGAFGFNPRTKYLELLNALLQEQGRPTVTSMPNPVVYWCPDCRYTVYLDLRPVNALTWYPVQYVVKSPPSHVMDKDRMFAGVNKPITRPLIWATKAVLPPEVVLFHELGHVVQYLTDKPQFVSWLRAHDLNALEADNLRKHEWPMCTEFGLGKRSNYHEDCSFLSELPEKVFFRCAEPGDRAELDRLIAANSAQTMLRGQPVTKVNYFTEHRVSASAD